MSLRDALSQVPWPDLTHAYGSAGDTPGHLLALLADDLDERLRAVDALWASICHQGTVYEASCAAVPFLIRIVREGPLDSMPSVLYLLAGVAQRDLYAARDVPILQMESTLDQDYRMHHHHVWWSAGAFLRAGSKYQDVRWMARAHQLVVEGLPDYLALLTSDDRSVVQASLYLLAAFQEAGDQVVRAIEALPDTEDDQVLAADALLALAMLLPADSPLWSRHLDRLTHRVQSYPLARYAAAIALARYRAGAVCPLEAVAELVEAVVAPERLDEQHKLLAGYDPSVPLVHVEACQVLSQLGVPPAIDGLTGALERGASRWRILDTIRVAEALLDAAFFGGWVENRYWQEHRGRAALLDDPARLFEERSFHAYGQSYGSLDELDITCIGYADEEAARLRECVTREGGDYLTADQRRALEAVLRCEPIWYPRHNLLDIYGLPRDREALQVLLKRI